MVVYEFMDLSKPEPRGVNFFRAPRCPGRALTRRDFIHTLAGAGAVLTTGMAGIPGEVMASSLPEARRAPTTLGLCKRYEFDPVRRCLSRMLEELGDVRRLVRRQHVTVKVNLVNTSEEDIGGVPLCLTVTTHPVVAMALGSLLTRYGARSVTFCEQLPFRASDAEAFSGYGFRLTEFEQAMSGRVRFENTRNCGRHGAYAWVKVPGTPELASAWEVSPAYVKTDVFVSLTKLKSHVSAGVSCGMKNLFGVPPSSLYGDDLEDRPDENAMGYRNQTMHNCTRLPYTSAESFTGRSIKGDHGFNVPRFVVDLTAAFPPDLTVIDGISTIETAEGWWLGSMVTLTRPGLLIAGRNPVCTDAVAAAVMGFNPDAADRTFPFVNGTNYLAMARKKGLGENRLERLEISGVGLDAARFEFHPTYQRART